MDKTVAAANEAGIKEIFVFGSAEDAPFNELLEPNGEPPEVEIDPLTDLIASYSNGTTVYLKGDADSFQPGFKPQADGNVDLLRRTLICVLPSFTSTAGVCSTWATPALHRHDTRFDLESILKARAGL
jgi:hypothetical protein